ncbi:MAG: rusticyanin [Acidithiobacillus ferrivorans]
MNTQTKMQKNRYVSVGVAAVLAATMGMGSAMAGTLDSSWKEATLPQVKAMLEKDTGKVSGDTVTYSGKTVHVVAAAVLPGFPFPSFEIHDVKNPTLDIPAGAAVDVTFINTNKGFGHSFDITKKAPPFAVMPNIKPIVAGTGFSPVPKDGKFGYSEFTWHPTAGTYYYVCQIPGHAATGMFGKIIVK